MLPGFNNLLIPGSSHRPCTTDSVSHTCLDIVSKLVEPLADLIQVFLFSSPKMCTTRSIKYQACREIYSYNRRKTNTPCCQRMEQLRRKARLSIHYFQPRDDCACIRYSHSYMHTPTPG